MGWFSAIIIKLRHASVTIDMEDSEFMGAGQQTLSFSAQASSMLACESLCYASHLRRPRNFTMSNQLLSEDFLADCHWQFSPATFSITEPRPDPATKIKCPPLGEHLILVDMDMTIWKQIKTELIDFSVLVRAVSGFPKNA